VFFYLTYGEYASGIYSSQVIDTCIELTKLSNQKFKLISFISIKNFLKERRRLKHSYSNVIVLPSFPKMSNYKFNVIPLVALCIFYKPNAIICRNAIPTKIGLMLKKIKLIKKVIFDGRAAEYEQYIEYKLTNDTLFANHIFQIEKESVNHADFKIAVSQELVNYWQNKFDYTRHNHVVIPCTLNSKHNQSQNNTTINREDCGYKKEDVILIYSGSVAQWQSFDLLFHFFEEQLINNKNIKIIFLCKETDTILAFKNKYKTRITQLWCSESEVNDYLSLADYGVLLRDNTWTNKVASPVKFAEYLNAGLDVIISPEVGDFSEFVVNQSCGYVYNDHYLTLGPLTIIKKNSNKHLVQHYFNKKSSIITEKYKLLLENIH
jgi:hypothetical protein